MNLNNTHRGMILAALAAVMVATRFHHFATVPDASWAVFLVGGFYLGKWTRWAFPALMALAVLVDVIVSSAMGQNFWQMYCVSAGYWMLVPAHAVMWGAGLWVSRHADRGAMALLPRAALAVVAGTALCHLFAQGGFYLFSEHIADKSFAGWAKNYSDWLPSYMGVVAMYAAGAAMVHVGVRALAPYKVTSCIDAR